MLHLTLTEKHGGLAKGAAIPGMQKLTEEHECKQAARNAEKQKYPVLNSNPSCVWKPAQFMRVCRRPNHRQGLVEHVLATAAEEHKKVQENYRSAVHLLHAGCRTIVHSYLSLLTGLMYGVKSRYAENHPSEIHMNLAHGSAKFANLFPHPLWQTHLPN